MTDRSQWPEGLTEDHVVAMANAMEKHPDNKSPRHHETFKELMETDMGPCALESAVGTMRGIKDSEAGRCITVEELKVHIHVANEEL